MANSMQVTSNPATPALVANPFGNAAPAVMPTSGQQAETSRAVAEVQAAILAARLNPRNKQAAVDRILNECTRPSLAETATYAYSRGGMTVTGASIRLAETIVTNWGNFKCGWNELSNKGGVSEVMAYAWDTESNVRREIIFTVPHVRATKGGKSRVEDPRDVYELVANQASRRVRACILAVIPGDVVEAALAQCAATLQCSADVTPDGIKRMVEGFGSRFGVTKQQIEAFCQCRAEAIKPAQVVRLRQIYASLRDGMSAPADWFEPIKATAAASAAEKPSLKEKLKKVVEAEAAAAPVREEVPVY